MGTKLTVSKEDVNALKLLTAGWYPCEVSAYEEKPSKSDQSLNRNVGFRIYEGESEGVKLRTTFNEKFSPLIGDFITACGGKFDVGETFDIEDAFKNKIRLLVYVKRGDYNGRPTNEVAGFRPLQ